MALNVAQNGLTRRQLKAIGALLCNPTLAQAAASVGIAERTLNRWLRQPAFKAALRSAESEAISEAVRVLVSDLQVSHATMRLLRDDVLAPGSVRLRAAQVLDEITFRWHEVVNVDARLTEIERKLEELNHGKQSKD